MPDNIFEERYKKLNAEQKRAVDAIEGPVMVIAGPGTGKTTILTLRIANILKKTDTPPHGILALTFTESGVKAMRKKLREIIGSVADEIRIHTFHGFAASVIAEFPEHFPHLSRSAQLTDVEAEALVRAILKDRKFAKLRPLGDPDFYVGKILGAIGDAKKEAWGADELRAFAEKEKKIIEEDPESISKTGATKGQLKADALKAIEKCERTILFADAYEAYEEKKKSERKMDFDDLLLELLQALKKDELLLRLLQEKFLYILVDEHQDTNDAQNLIVTLLASFFETPNIFVVGDEKQAIYRFQGASVENFLKFQKTWKDMQIISLSENFRSHQHILDAVYSMIETNYEEGQYEDLRVALKAKQKGAKPIDIVSGEDYFSLDEYLVEALKRIEKEEPDKTVAVILRWNRDVDHILSLCERAGIEASAERGADIFTHPLGMLFFKILEYIGDPTQTESLAFSIGAGLWDLPFKTQIETIRNIRSGKVDGLHDALPRLKALRKDLEKAGVLEALILIGEYSGLTIPDRMRDPLSVEVWRAILDLSQDLARERGISDLPSLISELLDYKKTAETKTIKIGAGSVDANIQVMTAHSSKGLEYDYVFVPYALEEYWMRKPRGSFFVMPREKGSGDEVKDARRLFYVALTRAREHISILAPQTGELGKETTVLRFVEELDKGSVKHLTAPKVSGVPTALSGKELAKAEEKEILDYAKRTLLENGLSVTALNHFLKCPSEFLYKSLYKVPEAPNPSSEKGIAMHRAMSDVWRSDEKTEKSIAKTIEDSIKDCLDDSLLAVTEKEMVEEELLKNAAKVAKALVPHFAQPGKVFTDRWLDAQYSGEYAKKPVEFRLHGQLDAIVEGENAVSVFDYKTKQGMTERAIRGETKNDDGNYFRQLIFYKMLVDKSQFKDKKAELSLVFVSPDDKGRCPTVTLPIGSSDIERVQKEILSIVESIYSGNLLLDSCDDSDCEWCRMKRFSFRNK
jgi:DNA helicase-2/ATP-dependent DNA helicase PcrA